MDVCKRDGSIEIFHLYKIVDALKKKHLKVLSDRIITLR
jgi:hypothetical protein